MKTKAVLISLAFILICFVSIVHSDGEPFYDLTGEWDAIYDSSLLGITKDTITMTQEGSIFVGIRAIGNRWVPKGIEAIKGELNDRVIKQVAMRYQKDYPASNELFWSDGSAVITDWGKKMIIQTLMETESGKYLMTVTLTKKQ